MTICSKPSLGTRGYNTSIANFNHRSGIHFCWLQCDIFLLTQHFWWLYAANHCPTAEDPYHTLIFGTMLITLYARARWHDIQAASIYPIWSWHTSPWISWTSLQEVQNRQCFGQENRIFTYLPITAVCFSISQQPWLAAYIQARQHFSLSISGALFQPLLPQKLHDELVLHAAWTFFGTDHQAPPPYLSRSCVTHSRPEACTIELCG